MGDLTPQELALLEADILAGYITIECIKVAAGKPFDLEALQSQTKSYMAARQLEKLSKLLPPPEAAPKVKPKPDSITENVLRMTVDENEIPKSEEDDEEE